MSPPLAAPPELDLAGPATRGHDALGHDAAGHDAAGHDAAPALDATAEIRRLEASVARVVRGKDEVIRFAVVALLAEGHLLIEDIPGVGKTTLAQALARSLGLAFQRVQLTADLLPSDIIGISVFNQARQEFELVAGPLFANVVLADEINRATPKTQSALLEAMSERKVSVERRRYTLPAPFVVLATQNPVEHLGTFPLPESQLDRFLMALDMGYPAREIERELLVSGGVERTLESLQPVLSGSTLLALQKRAKGVLLVDKLVDYVLDLAAATRSSKEVALPVSTRGAQGLYRAVQALALCEGRDYAVPDDVQRLAPAVLGHRIVLRRGHGGIAEGRALIERLVRGLPVPI